MAINILTAVERQSSGIWHVHREKHLGWWRARRRLGRSRCRRCYHYYCHCPLWNLRSTKSPGASMVAATLSKASAMAVGRCREEDPSIERGSWRGGTGFCASLHFLNSLLHRRCSLSLPCARNAQRSKRRRLHVAIPDPNLHTLLSCQRINNLHNGCRIV